MGLLNIKGEEITEIKYDNITHLIGQYRRVKVGKLYGMIDSTGKELVPPIYRYVSHKDPKFIKFYDDEKSILIPISEWLN